MASSSSTSFERSLDKFRDYLSKDQKQQVNAANFKDLDAAIQEMQAKLGRDKRLCNFRRMEKFLDAMKDVEQLVTIFLNVHEVVAFVWGPIKLALMAATTWANSIKQLIDAYEEIGEALSNLAFFHTLIESKGGEHLRQAVEDYFSDILSFHRCVLDVFSRPNWQTFFKAAWGSFRRQVERIIKALKLRQERLSHERLQAHAIHEGVRDFREHAGGKTTLATKVIRHLKSNPSGGSTVYFFFRHDDEHRKSAKPMLRDILSQLIQQDETIMRYLYEKCANMSHNLELSSLATLQDLTLDCLTSQTSVSILLDGLDECAENEPGTIITWFLKKVLPSAASRGCHLKLLVCGQRDGRLDGLLSTQPQIRLDTVELHQRDIEEYSKSRAAEIYDRFFQTPEQGEELAAKVAKTSQGMFLYTKVVMSNFLSMDSADEFEDEMEDETFPEDLDKAYERIVQRILINSKPSRQKTVKKILGWLICSKRPLRWREIQSSFCIDAERGTCNTKRRRVDSCKKICSSLVDITICDLFGSVESEEIVHMVHETAGKYLVQRGVINLLQEHANMALFCCRYLSSQPFLQDLETTDVQNALRSGYFGLLDYATAHCSDHIQEAQKHASSLPADVITSAMRLLTAYSRNTPNESVLEMEASAQTVTNTLRAENIDLLIQARLVVIRAATESQHHDLSKEDAYLNLSGPLRFKCPRVSCSKFTTGFRNKATRDLHLENHERPYRCTYTDCFGHDVGYESLERLEAHCEAFHRDTVKLSTFPSTKDAKPKDIFEACKQGNLELVKEFHLAGAQLGKSTTMPHLTPLYLATQSKHAKGSVNFQQIPLWYTSGIEEHFQTHTTTGSQILVQIVLSKGLILQSTAPVIEVFYSQVTDSSAKR
ncbi:hypothetical protein CDV36_013332 [Fusarium kuroshium]|uniref:Uncharacterized protein n=1 Tax=Fusarium kuroshium TaxID=2010991 RepID=A0A3M2RP05_9HYPO|nr:hypothetical protein CDV36_013332 [Fusarium kuroshium]